MVPDWMAWIIVTTVSGFAAMRIPYWIREAIEDGKRWEQEAKDRNRAYDYRNIPARLDKWQQERRSGDV